MSGPPRGRGKKRGKKKSSRSKSAPPASKPAAPRGRGGRGRSDPEGTELLGGAVRLQKVLARAGLSSRRGGEQIITEGRVKLNGRVVRELGVRVNPAKDSITVDGKPIAIETPVYIVLHKPDGYVSSAERDVDDRGRATVVSLLKGVPQRVYPVGRLDYHTRGVLLLTNDGDLSSRLLHPRYKVPKTYHAKFQGRVTPEEVEALMAGVTLEDGVVTRPLEEVLPVKETETNTWLQLTLTQGLYRQVRRMGEAIGHPVLKLIRVAFADITTDGLREGQWRQLRESEIGDLRARTEVAG